MILCVKKSSRREAIGWGFRAAVLPPDVQHEDWRDEEQTHQQCYWANYEASGISSVKCHFIHCLQQMPPVVPLDVGSDMVDLDPDFNVRMVQLGESVTNLWDLEQGSNM